MTHDKEKLPELPKGWVWTRVGELYDIIGGGTPSTNIEAYWKGDTPWITSADIQGLKDIKPRRFITKTAIKDSTTNLVPAGSLIVVTRVGLGKVALAEVPLCFSQDSQALIKKNDALNENYALYYLSQAVQIFKYKHRGTTIPGVTKKQLSDLSFALPPLPEQRRIVAKIEELFTRLDAGVEALRKVKSEIRRYRQAVLKHAFEGRLTEEWREAHKGELEPAFVLLERIKEERKKNARGKFKELPPVDASELPSLQEGWEWARVGELADNVHYGYTESATEEPVGPKFLRITDIQDNSVNWDSVPYCKIENSDKQKYLLKDGDLVFARTGATVGKSFLIVGEIPEAVFASYLIRILLNCCLNKKYVYNFFQSLNYWTQISEGKLGIGQPNVNAQILSQIILPLPPLPEQHKIVEEIERHFSIADEVEASVDQCLKQAERLRQSILKRAFEGRLVPQDPTDEPAEKLIERIKLEKTKQSNEGKIKQAKRKMQKNNLLRKPF